MRGEALRRVGRRWIVGASLLAATALAAGCGGDDAGSATASTTASTIAATTAASTPQAASVLVWFADQDAGLTPVRIAVAAGADPLATALDALAEGPDDPALLPALPEGTRILGATSDGAVATVDMSTEFESGYPSGGAAAEIAVIGPIVRTASGASGAPRVLLLVDGRAPAPVGTQFDLSRPLAVGDLPQP